MSPFGAIWNHLRLFGIFWDPLILSERIWTIWESVGRAFGESGKRVNREWERLGESGREWEENGDGIGSKLLESGKRVDRTWK